MKDADTGSGTPPIDFGSMFALLQAWDTDGDGLVSSADFKLGLSSIGFQISEQDADVLCRAGVTDTDGTMFIFDMTVAAMGGRG